MLQWSRFPLCCRLVMACTHAMLLSHPALPPVQAHVLNATDAVCSHPELLIDHYANVLGHLLPALSAAGTGRPAMCCLPATGRSVAQNAQSGREHFWMQPCIAALPSCCSCQPARNA